MQRLNRAIARKLVLAAALAVAPFAASTAPTVQFVVPIEGGALWGNVQGPPNCIVTGSNVKKVMFYLDDVWTNTDGKLSNGLGCWIDTRKHPDGTYVLKAVAYDSAGQKAIATRKVTINNAAAPAVSGSRPAIAFQAPQPDGLLTGNVQGPPQCVVTGYNIARVMFYLDGTWTNTDGNLLNGLGCWLDTTKYPAGSYTVRAVAYNSTGESSTLERAVTIGGTTGGGTIPPGGTAIATFESLGLYWNPPSNPGGQGCQVRYRKEGESTWKDGFPMWFDGRNSECRGSLVHLAPGTKYEVQFSLPGQPPAARLTATTWAENFPITQTVYVSSGSQQLNITQGGTASGYVLYTPAPGMQATIDVANAADYNIRISAPYVIVRGLMLKGARIDAIHLAPGARDIVIEDNDISGWGRYSHTNAEGWQIGMNADSGIKAYCGTTPWLVRTVIQRNRIHHPRYGSNSWSEGHPSGPNAVYFAECGGNHVFRYNAIYSDSGRYFNDGYGGGENFSTKGMPNSDSDVYGNLIMHVWDDAIEADFCFHNCRVMRNRITNSFTGLSSQPGLGGPVYFIRNAMYNLTYVPFKLHRYSHGDVILHNTTVKVGDGMACFSSQPFDYAYFRNNLSIGGPDGGVRWGGYGAGAGMAAQMSNPGPNCSFDYDAVGTWQTPFAARIGGRDFFLVEPHGMRVDMGVFEVAVSDTIGIAHPGQVPRVLEPIAARVPPAQLALHFHDTRGTALANVLTALDLGIATFDASCGGLGGCPYAPGATGNLATEDLMYMLSGLGIETGVDMDALMPIAERHGLAVEKQRLVTPLLDGIHRGVIEQRVAVDANERPDKHDGQQHPAHPGARACETALGFARIDPYAPALLVRRGQMIAIVRPVHGFDHALRRRQLPFSGLA